MPDDPSSAYILVIVLAAVGAIALVVDAIIFFRWIKYLWAKYDVEERLYREGAQRAEAATYAPDSDMAAALDPQTYMPRYPFARTWSLIDPYLGFQAAFIIAQLVLGAAMLPLMFANGKIHGQEVIYTTPGMLILCTGLFFQNALFVGVTAFYVHRYGATLKEIGLRRPTALQLAMGFGGGLILFLVAMGTELAVGNVLPHLLPKAVWDSLQKFTEDVTAGGMFTKIPSLQLKIFFALAGAVAAPIGEEVFFRGLLYNSLKRRINVSAAIVLSGLLFALIHFGPLAILAIFPMGMLLAYVYEKTGSLWVTICMHATNNGLSFVLAMAGIGVSPAEPAKPAPPPTKHAILREVPMKVAIGSVRISRQRTEHG